MVRGFFYFDDNNNNHHDDDNNNNNNTGMSYTITKSVFVGLSIKLRAGDFLDMSAFVAGPGGVVNLFVFFFFF